MGQRISSFHFMSGSKFFDTIINLFKQAMSQKLAKRVRVHDSLESLHKLVDKDTLPPEYGGNGKSMQQHDGELKHNYIIDLLFLRFDSTASIYSIIVVY